MPVVISSGQTLSATVGETSDYTIASGGVLVYDVGATLSTIELQSGAIFVEVGRALGSGVSMTVAPFTSDVTINVGAGGTTADVTSASSTTVDSGGALIVASGGFATATTVSAGGAETVHGTESGGVIASGGVLIDGANGVVLSETVLSGGVLSAVSGGVLGQYPLSGGSVVRAGGELVIAGGGTYGDSLIYGTEIVSGGAAFFNYYDTIESGGRQEIYSGAQGSASVTSGGVVDVYSGGYGSEEVFGGGVAIAHFGGTLRGLDIAGAEFDVMSGGAVEDSFISAGSVMRLEGGTSGFADDILAGSTVIEEGVTLSAGQTQTLAPNTSSLFSLEWNGALLSGATSGSGTVVGSGATLIVSGGAVASGTLVEAGGSETVAGEESGGVLSGGVVDIVSGGSLDGLDFSGAGRLIVESGGAVSGLISGFAGAVDVIDVAGAGEHLVWSQGAGSGTLEWVASGGAVLETITLAGAYTQSDFRLTQTGGYEEAVYCFACGTLILTSLGEVAVEALRPGDVVITADGGQRSIQWIGVQTIGSRFADPMLLFPVRIRKGALGDGRPTRDLLVSPGHALMIDGLLIQAGALVNEVSIVREASVPEGFAYYHIELAEHGLVIADGVPAESFLDARETAAFDNYHERKAAAGGAPTEMPYPRVKARRQVPAATLRRLDAAACGLLVGRAA